MILITGASGFLGQYLLATASPDKEILVHYHKGTAGKDRIIFDLRDEFSAVLDRYPIRTIIHLASMARVDDCEMDEVNAWKINVEGTAKLVAYANKRNCRFIYVSTDLVFDGTEGPYTEHHTPRSIIKYGWTKRKAEIVCQELDNVVIARLALLVGKPIGQRSNFTAVMKEKLNKGEKVRVFFDEFRTPLWAEDAARALWYLAEHPFTGIVHLHGPDRLNREEMARILCRHYQFDENLLEPVSSDAVQQFAPRPKDCSLQSLIAPELFPFSFRRFEDLVKSGQV